MMGKDIERLLSNTDNLINVVNSSIQSLIEESMPINNILEFEPIKDPRDIYPGTNHPMNAISDSMDALRFQDHKKMRSLNKDLFVSSDEFNNNIGSPWTELERLNTAVSDAEEFASSHKKLSSAGEKLGMLVLMQTILSFSIDFKWALIHYHDYIQRGYDNNFNDKKPSITFKTGLNKITNSNINQEFNDNVNIRLPSIDPF